MSKSTRFFNLAAAPKSAKRDAGKQLQIKIQNGDNGAEILIYEQIGEDYWGDGISARSVVDFLNANRQKPVEVRINSPGGFVYDGLTIYNAMASHSGRVTVTIEGLAYSAASFIAMAGDHVRMYPASDIGIHRASVITIGNQKDHQASREWLATIDEHLIDIYQAKSGRPRKEIVGWIDGVSDGTVFSAAQAKQIGFCDEIIGNSSKGTNSMSVMNRAKMQLLRSRAGA
ncbi:Clp protease ClpP [Stieleria sp. TO1_6]|uniref:head maturation protease, ClpP-related n=1 Tax=Stieleria tagensis TaxID=2956795 RepID=UPI00209B9538|nr:head maturation protease, ClpP-related [Stieleria tagensis]MCO8124502.1 Clp protease ClpP [Stieleria tagensis]